MNKTMYFCDKCGQMYFIVNKLYKCLNCGNILEVYKTEYLGKATEDTMNKKYEHDFIEDHSLFIYDNEGCNIGNLETLSWTISKDKESEKKAIAGFIKFKDLHLTAGANKVKNNFDIQIYDNKNNIAIKELNNIKLFKLNNEHLEPEDFVDLNSTKEWTFNNVHGEI